MFRWLRCVTIVQVNNNVDTSKVAMIRSEKEGIDTKFLMNICAIAKKYYYWFVLIFKEKGRKTLEGC